MKKLFSIIIILSASALTLSGAAAGEADVVNVEISRSAGDTYHFDVSVKHDDSGWGHYADRWEVLDGKGNILGTRVLLHPHENEQPFTRSLSGVKIPAGIASVIVRAHDKVHAFGGKEMTVKVPR